MAEKDWPSCYVLNGHTPEPRYGIDGLLEASELFRDQEKRRVGWDEIGDAIVSTVFTPFTGDIDEEPFLFETGVRKAGRWRTAERYQTWEEAEIGHKLIVAMLKEKDE